MEKIHLASKELGNWGEQIAVDYLQNHNVKIVGRNIRTNYGEIDILGQKDGVLIFFEVKTRRTEKFGNPEDAVNYIKQEHMKNSALEFIQSNQDMEMDWRIDVIAIYIGKENKFQIRWFKNAIAD
jgi:putative endonuclease